MFNKLVLFLTLIIVVITMNSHYHLHVENHDNHNHIHINSHEGVAEQTSFHLAQNIDSQKNLCTLGGILLLLVLFKSRRLFFFQRLQTKVIQLLPENTFYTHIFVYSPPTLLRSILFHAPPH